MVLKIDCAIKVLFTGHTAPESDGLCWAIYFTINNSSTAPEEQKGFLFFGFGHQAQRSKLLPRAQQGGAFIHDCVIRK